MTTTWNWAGLGTPAGYLGVAITDLERARDAHATEAASALTQLAEAEVFIQHARRAIVATMRENGATWDQVGDALGISKQGARKVYGGH